MMQIDKIIDRCLKSGADMADVYLISRNSLNLSVRNSEVESVTRATPGGLAIRYYKDGKMAFAHSTQLDDAAIDLLISKCAALSGNIEADKFAVLPSAQPKTLDLDIFSPAQTKVSTEDKIAYLRNLESLALKFDPVIGKSNGVSYEEDILTRELANSKGVKANYDFTFYRVGLSIVAEKNGEMFPGEGSMFVTHFDMLPSPEKIVEIFASRAVRLIGGTPVAGGDYEIIFSPRGADSILWGLSAALNGDSVFKGTSFLSGKLGQKIAVDGLTLIDDPTRPKGIASRPFDDEGTQSAKNILIENGIVKGYLYDQKTALKAGAKSTGSSRRDDFSSFPEIGVSNFYIAPGKDKFEDVVASCKKGIIVEVTQGWGLQSVTGQYSAGINGTLVENGKRIRPVAGVTIAASADEILNGIGAICDNISFYDNMACPAIMVKRMTVGG
jgi:PmbA protein